MNEDNKIFKTNEFSIEISPVREAIKAKDIQYFSYDENSGLQLIHILMDGKPLDLPNGTEIRLSAVKLNNQNQKLIYTPEIVDPLKGIVSFVIPREFLGYQGQIRCGLYINFSNNQTMHVGYFYINMGVSDIDTNITEFTEDFWQGWSEFEAGSTAKMQELEQRIDEQTKIFNNADVYNKTEIEEKLEPFAHRTDIDTLETSLAAVLSDANKFRTDIDSLELKKADNIDLEETNKTINFLDAKKADKSFVDAQFASIVSGAPKGTYATLTALELAYPQGTDGIFLVLENGNWYYWNAQSKIWLSGGIYQSEKAKYSVLPKNLKYWHTFKVSDTVGVDYIFNNTVNSLQNTENYFETSVAGYGAYSCLLDLPEIAYRSVLYLRGTVNYRISLIEYNENAKVIRSSQWANTIDWTLSNECRKIALAIKRYDDAPMTLSEVSIADCNVYSDVFSGIEKTFIERTPRFGEWLQGAYHFDGNGVIVGGVTYSNLRMSNFVDVNPSTFYKLKCSLLLKYRFVLVLADENNRQIMNCGWVTTKDEVVIRTPPNCSKIYIMLANVDDTKTFKDADRLLMEIKFSTLSNIEVDQYRGPASSEPFLVNNTWFNLSIGKGSDGKVSIPVAANRLLTRFDVKSDKIYSIETDAPSNYRFNYVQADDTGNYLHDTYWQIGGCRIKNDVKGYVYISVHKLDESNNAVDINLSEAANFTITVKETTVFNELLERRFRSRLICHRGASAIEPENTLPAFARCGILNVWGCEMDVQLTKDKHFVIIHDDTVDRTTNGTGKVAELTLDEIKALTVDWGPNISNYPDLKVPTLKEAVDTCRIYGTIPVFDIGTFGLGSGDVAAINQFLQEIESLGIIQDCIILCQGTFLASTVRQKNKLTPIITQYTGVIGADLEARRLFRFENGYCGGWNLTATDDQLKELYAVGKTYQLQFYAITNDKEQAKKYLELGCDFISSDYPDILDFE
ncbi:glycerophosphodiester phosphodiesterase family protein [Enterococcus dongliensis]|uniref:glycerophosphodiester phosphodiesterase family protein n=1 Tax=Enterococcus dongliensis TaxID=2559925 RepID=UPI00288EFDC6|nr:glycerophosphodiester phosphodiesterase family protein [Enterococcus dongliensis]MDT2670003.1 glycerophosphodiester phosphodiesterase family protein [Enterococcus dongliensis]